MWRIPYPFLIPMFFTRATFNGRLPVLPTHDIASSLVSSCPQFFLLHCGVRSVSAPYNIVYLYRFKNNILNPRHPHFCHLHRMHRCIPVSRLSPHSVLPRIARLGVGVPVPPESLPRSTLSPQTKKILNPAIRIHSEEVSKATAPSAALRVVLAVVVSHL